MSVVATYQEPPAGWLRKSSFDLSFILGIAIVAMLSAAIVIAEPRLFAPVLLIDLWFLGYHHVISTFTRLCFDKESMKEHRFLIFGLPPLVIAGTFAMAYGVGLWTIGTIYLYWQWLHYTRQSWGVSQAYRRKAGNLVKEDQNLAWLAFYSLPLWGILYRSHQDPGVFLGMELRVIPVAGWMVDAVAVVAIASVAMWTFQRARAFIAGEGPIAHTLYMASHFVIFTVSYLLIEDITIGWLCVNIWHNAQYVVFVWLFNTNKFRDGVTPKAAFLSKLSQPKNWIGYFAFSLALSTAIYFAISQATESFNDVALPAALIVYSAINFHHYIVDSVIWKMRKPKIQKDLALTEKG